MIFIYTNCRDIEQAKELGEKIIKAKAAVAVDIFPIESIYRTEEGYNKESEAVLLIKTQEFKVATIEEFLKKYHTYSVPFVGVINIDRINIEQRDWANKQIVH